MSDFDGANEVGVDDRAPKLPELFLGRCEVTEFFKQSGHNGVSYILKFRVLSSTTHPDRVGMEHAWPFSGLIGSRRKMQLQKIRAMTAACMKVDGAADLPFGPDAINAETGKPFTWVDCMENGLKDAQPLAGCQFDIATSETHTGQTSGKPYTIPTFSAVL